MKMKWLIGFVLVTILFSGSLGAQEPQPPLTIEESVKIALERNLALHSSVVGVEGSEFRRKEAPISFLYGQGNTAIPDTAAQSLSGLRESLL
jgi:hypothetical protein